MIIGVPRRVAVRNAPVCGRRFSLEDSALAKPLKTTRPTFSDFFS